MSYWNRTLSAPGGYINCCFVRDFLGSPINKSVKVVVEISATLPSKSVVALEVE
jgi:hypothetical protein